MSELLLNVSLANSITNKLKEAGYTPNEMKQYISFDGGRDNKVYLTYSRNSIRATKSTEGESIIRSIYGEPNGRASDSQEHKYSTWFFNGHKWRGRS